MRRVECDFHITARTIGRKHRSQLIGEWKGANKCINSGSRNLPGIISLNVWGKFGQMWVIWSQRQGPDGQNGRLDWCKSDPGSRICQDTHCWRRLFCGHPESMVGSLKFVRCRMFYHIWKSKNICIIQFPDMVIHSARRRIVAFQLCIYGGQVHHDVRTRPLSGAIFFAFPTLLAFTKFYWHYRDSNLQR